MKILHIVTTGESLLRCITDRSEDDYKCKSVARAVTLAPDGPDTVAELLAKAEAGGGLDALFTVCPRGLLRAVSRVDAAEWTSLAAIAVHPDFRPPDPWNSGEHAYLFLASDTDPGLRAAALLAAGTDAEQIHYLPEPLVAGDRWVPAGQAWVARIPGLDLGKRAPTPKTWRSLGACGRVAAHTVEASPGEWTVVLHVSGGYKALLPHVMVLAEGLRSRLGMRGPMVRAFATHENSVPRDGVIGVDAPIMIEIPVRALAGRLWEKVAELATAMPPMSTRVWGDVAPVLLGLATDPDPADPRHAQVNAAGLILTQLV